MKARRRRMTTTTPLFLKLVIVVGFLQLLTASTTCRNKAAAVVLAWSYHHHSSNSRGSRSSRFYHHHTSSGYCSITSPSACAFRRKPPFTTTNTRLYLASSSPSSSSSTTKQKKTNNKKKRQRRQQRRAVSKKIRGGGSNGQQQTTTTKEISKDDLVEHVSNLYIYGPGGILRRRKKGVVTANSSSNSNRNKHTSNASPANNKHNKISHNTIQRLNQHPALVLNADYQPLSALPLSLWHWQDAIKAVFGGKVTVVDVYPDVVVRACNFEIPLPSVIALNEYVPNHRTYNMQNNNNRHNQNQQQGPAFTKRNVFLRDMYMCQYCSKRFPTRELTLDHVVPRCRGGQLTWSNAVTCCHHCNGKKGCYNVHDIKTKFGMELRNVPKRPTQQELVRVAWAMMLPHHRGRGRGGIHHPTWEPYLMMGTDDDAS